jgi:hypothetical protein
VDLFLERTTDDMNNISSSMARGLAVLAVAGSLAWLAVPDGEARPPEGTRASAPSAAHDTFLASDTDRLSYALGANLADRLRRGEVEVDPALIARGFADARSGAERLLTDDEVRALLAELGAQLEQRRTAIRRTGSQNDGANGQPEVADIRLSFKLDPRLTHSLYMGDRWVVPTATYTQVGDENGVAVEARVLGVDGSGQPVVTEAEWTPADPDMVTISAGSGEVVTIKVLREGRTSVRVTARGVSRDLAIRASRPHGAMQVEIDAGEVSRTTTG